LQISLVALGLSGYTSVVVQKGALVTDEHKCSACVLPELLAAPAGDSKTIVAELQPKSHGVACVPRLSPHTNRQPWLRVDLVPMNLLTS
jgi:hypothetical protein